jgi:hypothetical protein
VGRILDLHRLSTDQPDPPAFLAHFPGAFLQYFDDSRRRDPRMALSTRHFDRFQASRKQREGCGVAFSPNAFVSARRLECLRRIQAVFLDIDCAKEGDGTLREEIERRKEEALLQLLGSRLPPHAITETKNGLQPIWRVAPTVIERDLGLFRTAVEVLLRQFGGDPSVKDPTHVLRLPGSLHLKNPAEPFRCRLLWDELDRVADTLQALIGEFYSPPEPITPRGSPARLPCPPPSAAIDIAEVIGRAAAEAGIAVTLRWNRDGSRQIVEDGRVTSGFISARGNFCYSSSGKSRKGGPLQLVQFYLGLDRDGARQWLGEHFGQPHQHRIYKGGAAVRRERESLSTRNPPERLARGDGAGIPASNPSPGASPSPLAP